MANNWAIVIGINHYDHHPERQLKYAVPDAQSMRNFLVNQAGFVAEQVLLCLGDVDYRSSPTYPTYGNLLRLLSRELHPDRIGAVDRLWFCFGGHGVSQNGRDYLLTADSLLEDVELKIALPIDEVIAALRRHQAADIVLVLDNCRQQQGSRKLIDVTGQQTIELARNRGITTIFSCDYGQYSYELDSLQHGAFTYALIEGLQHHTLPDQLEQYLRRRVAELNQRHDQIPRIRVEPAAKALQPLLPSAVTAADLTVLVERAREAELEENFEVAKQIWWEVIEVAQSGERIREARTAIDRIDRKLARLRSDQSEPEPVRSSELIKPSEPAKPPEPSEPRNASINRSASDSAKVTPTKPVVSTPSVKPGSTPAPPPRSAPAQAPAEVRREGPSRGSASDRTNPASSGSPSVLPFVSPQWSRQRFLKWAGLGGAGLVTAVVGREVFKTATHSTTPQPNPTSSTTPQSNQSPTSSSVVSVADPKYTQLAEEAAKGLPLWKVDFETVTVDQRGQVIDRLAKQAMFFKEDLGNGVILEMVKIPGGSFKMGSPETEQGRRSNESPQRTVTVPSLFVGRFAVTQAQYQSIMGTNPAKFKGEKRPVEQVSWNDAIEFCTKLSQQTGRKYRLPSEAEWEYACRAGTTTPFYFGETITGTLANYDASVVYRSEPKGEYRQQTTEVGTFPPNAFGLYDMHGNVWEWCADHYHENYQNAPIDGSAWLSDNQNPLRLLRGGSWCYNPEYCRSACRHWLNADYWNNYSGFRVVCSLARTL